MAYLPAAIVTTYTTLGVIDYAGSPVTTTIGVIDVDSIDVPILDEVENSELMINSSTGKARYAFPVLGLAGGQDGSFNLITTDPKNDTDVTAILSLFRALAKNSVSGTGFSGYTFTSQQTGLGKLQCKLAFTMRGQDGTSHVVTCPAIIKTVKPIKVQGSIAGYTVNYTLAGAITVA